jgi:hypothetical protein
MEKWKQTNYYELCSKSEFYGCANFATIKKEFSNSENEALIYLLERIIIETESWNEKIISEINHNTFLRTASSMGYINTLNSKKVEFQSFLNDINEIIVGIQNEPNCKITLNGNNFESKILFQLDDILTVICYDDKWNNRQYFFETQENWNYFIWSTSA